MAAGGKNLRHESIEGGAPGVAPVPVRDADRVSVIGRMLFQLHGAQVQHAVCEDNYLPRRVVDFLGPKQCRFPSDGLEDLPDITVHYRPLVLALEPIHQAADLGLFLDGKVGWEVPPRLLAVTQKFAGGSSRESKNVEVLDDLPSDVKRVEWGCAFFIHNTRHLRPLWPRRGSSSPPSEAPLCSLRRWSEL